MSEKSDNTKELQRQLAEALLEKQKLERQEIDRKYNTGNK